jgi:Skp family chaperone for outer membrane proteins
MNLTLIVGVASAVVAGLVGWTANGWRLNAKIDNMVAQHSSESAKASKEALIKYAEMERNKQNAINEANKRAQQNAAAAASARLERDRLREQVNANTASLSTATCPSIRAYASTLSTVFQECVGQLEQVAKDADGHSTDSRALTEAWPQ